MKFCFSGRKLDFVLFTVLKSEMEEKFQLVKIRAKEDTVISLSNRSNKDIGNGDPKISLLRYIKLFIVVNFPELS